MKPLDPHSTPCSATSSVCARSLAIAAASWSLMLLAACGQSASAPGVPADVQRTETLSVPIPVDELAGNPESFQGFIAVSGRVLEANQGGGGFTLGCEDACVRVPVRFKGKPPEAPENVVVRGRVTKNHDGLYIFEAESVERP